jgi:hypothetical protein
MDFDRHSHLSKDRARWASSAKTSGRWTTSSAENLIVKSQIDRDGHNSDLSKGLRDHLEETKGQIARLEGLRPASSDAPNTPMPVHCLQAITD